MSKSMYLKSVAVGLTLCAIFLSASPAAAQQGEKPKMTAVELLNKYEAAQKPFTLQASKIEHLYKVQESGSKGEIWGRVISEYQRNPEGLFHTKVKWWPQLNSPNDITHRDEPAIKQSIWDGKYWYDYTEKAAYVAFTRAESNKLDYLAITSEGAKLDGFLYGDQEPVSLILRKANSLSIREKNENINGSDCYVLEADTTSGRYTLWLDPEHGCNIARVEVHKDGNDIFRGKPLNSPPPELAPEQLQRFPNAKDIGDKLNFSLENIHFEKHGEIWVPVEADYQWEDVYNGGRTRKVSGNIKRFQIDLNPDFKAIGAFVPNFPDGTRAFDMDHPNTGIKYEWRNEKITACQDKEN
jgi:hypothetical protein